MPATTLAVGSPAGTRFAHVVGMKRAARICLGALAIAGCGEPAPEHIDYDDVARMVGATIATSDGGATMGAVNDSILLAYGGMPAGFTFEDGAIYGDHGGLEHQYIMVTCRDRENQVIKPCTQMTNTATLIALWSGSIDGPDLDVRSNRRGMWTLDDLQTSMPIITGSSYLQTEGTVRGRAYELTATESETMITPDYRIGGSIHLDLVVTRIVTDPFEIEIAADIVFDNAMRDASITLDGGHQYRVDLRTGRVEP